MGQDVEKAQTEILTLINNKAEGYWETKNELDKAIKNSLNVNQKKYLDNKEIMTYYYNVLNDTWTQIERKKDTIKNNINNKLLRFYDDESSNSKQELEQLIRQSLAEEEIPFLDEPDIKSQLEQIWNTILKKRKDRIYNKLIQYSKEEIYDSKEQFEEKINTSLLENEKCFLNDQDIINQIQLNWNSIEKRNKKQMDLKKMQFRNIIEKKIYDVYLNNKDSCKTEKDLGLKFELSLTPEEQAFLADTDIKIFYNQTLSQFWYNISKRRESTLKDTFKNNIKYIIKEIYNSSSYNEKEDLEKDVKNSLKQEEKDFLDDKKNDTYDQNIFIYFKKCLDKFWKKVQEEKANSLENEKIKIKNKIDNLSNRYSLFNHCENEENFNKEIEADIAFNEKEKKIIDENEDIKQYKKNKFTLFWKKMLELKEENKQNKQNFEALIKSHNEQISKLKAENEKNQKEQEEKLNQLLKVQEMEKKKREEEAKEIENKFKKKEEDLKRESEKKMKDLEDRLKKERDEEKKKQMMEEQKKLKELKDKKEKINNDFNKEVEKIKTEKIKRIEEELKGMEKTFCMKEIQEFDTNKIRELLKEILKSNKIAKFIENNLKIEIDKNKNNIKNTEHLNIILVGPSGVGKSTLINAILELEKQTETGFGMPQTMDIGFYNSNKLTFLRLADSRGIEKTKESGTEAICKQIEEFIKKQLETKDPDKFIHCIWYCWTGARLELSEIDVLNQLSKQYSLKTLPVIIVYTNAIDPSQAEEAEKYIKETIKLDNHFIPVLAKEKIVGTGKEVAHIKPYNLDKLKEVSFELAKSAVESYCYQGLIEGIKKIISEEINNLTNKVKESIDIDVRNILSKMNLDSKIEDLYNDNTNVILNIN